MFVTEIDVGIYLVEIVIIFLKGLKSLRALIAHTGKALQDWVIMFRLG
jgi:hypothetical protein